MTTAALPLLGPPLVTHHQAVETFLAKRARANGYTSADLNTIFRLYADACTTTGLCFAAAAAQTAHETGWLTSWWSARPRRNPAGIGVTGAGAVNQPKVPAAFDPAIGKWRHGISFPTWEQAVAAHVGRLLAYALPAGTGTPAQRTAILNALLVRPLPAVYRGCAPTLAGLGGTWAVPGTTYGRSLATKIDVMLSYPSP